MMVYTCAYSCHVICIYRHVLHNTGINLVAMIGGHLLDETGVDDDGYIVNCYGSLCNIGGHYNLCGGGNRLR